MLNPFSPLIGFGKVLASDWLWKWSVYFGPIRSRRAFQKILGILHSVKKRFIYQNQTKQENYSLVQRMLPLNSFLLLLFRDHEDPRVLQETVDLMAPRLVEIKLTKESIFIEIIDECRTLLSFSSFVWYHHGRCIFTIKF